MKSIVATANAAAAAAAVCRNLVDGKLSYRDFVWFLISEEDKRHPRRSVWRDHSLRREFTESNRS